MIFSSLEFIFLFLPASLALFWVARRLAGLGVVLGTLAVVSIFFYGVWKPQYVPLFLGSILANWALARTLGPEKRRSSALLFLSVAANLGLLFFYKYAAFASGVAHDLGLVSQVLPPRELPLGISFFTFQQIGYLVDRHRGIVPPQGLVRYALFVSFYPQLIAGPIVHHAQMMPQLERLRPTWEQFALGLFVFAIGLAKKVVLADSLADYASAGFAHPERLGRVNAWVTTLAYSHQLYLDFSGYSDMAVGLGLLFGVRLPWNFLSPYRAVSISQFWRRWHVTLSNFLRDYLFIPLGGSRGTAGRTAFALFLTMLLGGIWHGAGWTFVAWGTLHGVALVVNHTWRRFGLRMPWPAGWAMTMLVVLLGWVLFRAPSFASAGTLYARLAGQGGVRFDRYDGVWATLPYLAVAIATALFAPNARWWAERFRPTIGWAFAGALLFSLSIAYLMSQAAPAEFLYFDF
jgi:D-alanyl-lipoteichoic acid acyltransferase DltB (MBOAT superfamily)